MIEKDWKEGGGSSVFRMMSCGYEILLAEDEPLALSALLPN